MALVIVNQGQTPPQRLWHAAAALPPEAPVVIMVHGFRFAPGTAHDPHAHILALDPAPGARHAVSWPRALGFREAESPVDGLAVAFGWNARGTLRQAYGRAAGAGAELAGHIDALALTAQRPVAIIGHSLGARVALAALSRVAPGAVGRVILLSAAELRPQAESAVASPAGMLAEVINVTSRENDIYEFGMELVIAAGLQRGLGFGLARPRENWLDLQIDQPGTLRALRGMGFRISDRAARVCHWSPYTREGLFELYHAALRQPAALPLWLLRRSLPPASAPRFSRLVPRRGSRGDGAPGGGPFAPAA